MNLFALSLAVGLALAATSAATAAPSSPEDNLVGVWNSYSAVQPCTSTDPPPPFIPNNTTTFNAGGTVTDTTLFPPGGLPNANGVVGLNQRTNGTGVWSYIPSLHEYTLSLRFSWFVDGVYNGYQVVDRTMLMDATGQHLTGEVQTTRYDLGGNVLAKLCGPAISDRTL